MKDFNKIDLFIQKKRTELIERYVPNDSYILDIGCGYYPKSLMNLDKKIKKAVGIDKIIPDKTFSPKVDFIKTEICDKLPFPVNEFDCILILAVLEHLEHPNDIIRECFRILKPKGRIIITIPSNYSKPVLLTLAFLGLISKEEIFSHKHYFRRKDVEDLLFNANFKKILSKSYNLFMNSLFVFEK